MNQTTIKSIAEKLDRSIPPVPGKPKDINFPGFFETVLPSGITVLVIEDRRLPLVTARFVFRAGAYFENEIVPGKPGVASIASEMLSRGTLERNAIEIAEQTDFLGATLSTGADHDACYVSCYSLSKHFDEVFSIASDVILNPVFAEDELHRTKEQRVNSLLTLVDDGEYLASRAYRESVYGSNPYSFPVDGTIESVNDITTADVRKFYHSAFAPSNIIAAFVGDISPEEALKKLEHSFSGWSARPVQFAQPKQPPMNRSRIVLSAKTGAVQSSLRIGHVSIARDNPDFIPVSIMNTILGGYFTSRINRNLREVHGYTYSARSALNSHRFGGDISVLTEVKNEITANTVREILKEIRLLRDTATSDEELQNVKNYISGNFPLQLETPNAVATKAINLKLFGLENDYYNKYIQKVNELTASQLKEVAEKYLHPDCLVYSVSGNVEEIKGPMSEFGDVELSGEVN